MTKDSILSFINLSSSILKIYYSIKSERHLNTIKESKFVHNLGLAKFKTGRITAEARSSLAV